MKDSGTAFVLTLFMVQHTLPAGGISMAGGWSRDGAIQDQIDASVASEVDRARSRLTRGESLLFCEDCEEEIPEARRQAVPGVRRCVLCQEEEDRQNRRVDLYNRRGSKDSQLR